MTQSSWMKLKKGSIIKSVRSNTRRLVISARGGGIELKGITNNTYRLWSGYMLKHTRGKTTVVYGLCDCSYFKVIKF